MMAYYQEDRQTSDKVLPDVQWVIKTACDWDTKVASDHLDVKQATDLIVPDERIFGGIRWHVAVRTRQEKYFREYPFEFTIRSRRKTGTETELAKILDGFSDWLFYGFHDEEGEIRKFRIVNLMAFREAVRDSGERHFCREDERYNKNDGTHFWAFDVRLFEKPKRYPINFKVGAC